MMVYIQIDLPEDVDREVEIFSAKERIKDKRKSIIEMLRRYTKND